MTTEMVLLNIDQLRRRVDKAPSKNFGGVFEHWKKHSIYLIPSYMKDQNPTVYTPRLVSIGPYHHGAAHLAAMEEHKARSLQQFLSRSNQPFEAYRSALEPMAAALMDSYEQLDDKWKKNQRLFLELLVKDASFLCEFFNGCSNGWDYHPQDPVFSFDALLNICPYIIPDVLMMENQIPLTVIERLIAVQAGQLDKKHDEKAQYLVYKFLSCPEPFSIISLGLHVLDVSRKVTTRDLHQKAAKELLPAAVVKSASELLDAGVRFRANSTTERKGISFENGTLYLPLLRFDSSTEPLFLNQIAFEKLHPTAGREVSSYVAFMQGLISSPKDVRILTSLRLIESSVGRDEDVANMMNKISKHVFFDPYSELCEVRDLLNEYYDKKMKKIRRKLREWGRNLKQSYFKTPWTIISFIAATILLVLTFLQTFYSMKTFYNGSPSSPPPPPSTT